MVGQVDRAGVHGCQHVEVVIPCPVAAVAMSNRGSYSVPFVDGTPLARGSRSTAVRNARAKALNTVSAW